VEDYAIFLLSPEGNVISWNAGAQRNQSGKRIFEKITLQRIFEAAITSKPFDEKTFSLRAGFTGCKASESKYVAYSAENNLEKEGGDDRRVGIR